MPTEFDVVVIGAGFAGIYAVHKMRDDLGLSVKAFDAAGGPGGAWWWNRYPGARCDIESVHYSYSFSDDIQRGWEWTERFAAQPEILAYLDYAARKLDVLKEYSFSTRVTSTVWDDEKSRWTVTTSGGETCTSRFIIAATGNLSLPKSPEFPGVEDFKGELYMTSNWPHHELDFAGKRVGVIGVGSSGVQVIQTIASQVGQLTVFQRTPGFAVPLNNQPVDQEQRRWNAENHSLVRAGSRQHPFGTPYELPRPSSHADSEQERLARYERMYNEGGLRLISSAYADVLVDESANHLLSEWVRKRIGERVKNPEVAEMLKPTDHPYGTKRPPLEIEYYEAFNRDNVKLVDVKKNPITRIIGSGIETAEGVFELDVIILATGFDALTGPLLKLGIIGRNGISLSQKWADGPRSYLGIAMHGFPNLFTITGPTSAVALYNNPLAIEDHVEFAADAIRYTNNAGADFIEATTEAQDHWHAMVDGIMQMTLFPKANSWYMGANVKGKPRATSIFVAPAPLYRAFTGSAQFGEFGGFQVGGHRAILPPIMKLDPMMALIVGESILAGAKPFETCSIDEVRAAVKGLAMLQGSMRDVKVAEASYPAAEGRNLPVRIYNATSEESLPVLVYYHGGGFVAGSLESADKICRALAEDFNMVVIAPAYSLAPEHPFPAATNDSYAALIWASEVAHQYGGDPDRLILAGESAGANLAAVATLRARDEGGPSVLAQILITPAIDAEANTASRLDFADAPMMSTAAANYFWANYLGEMANAGSWLASPNRATTLKGLPPALLLTAECDPLRDEAEDYGRALVQAGVSVKAHRLTGLIHGSFNMLGVLPRSSEYTDAIRSFLNQVLTRQAPAKPVECTAI